MKHRTLNLTSRERKKHHIVIVGNFPDEESAKAFKKAMRQVIHKQNRLSHKSSFEMHLQFTCKNV